MGQVYRFRVRAMGNTDQRPPLWVGHIFLATNRLAQSADFMRRMGMRPVDQGEDYAIFELRGGTHLILSKVTQFTPGEADFDLMVDDLEATHRQFATLELNPSPIEPGSIHSSFNLREPGGNLIRVLSSHVGNEPV
jgi:catechol 2,3-dioxygenase-like lactoylglutathione lyase family enzyme